MTHKQIISKVKRTGFCRISASKHHHDANGLHREAVKQGIQIDIQLIDRDDVRGIEFYNICKVDAK